MRPSTLSSPPLDSFSFYSNYYGHTIPHLTLLHSAIKAIYPSTSIVWLVGDSSLDNKHWCGASSMAPAVNGYERLIDPPRSVKDIAYWMNFMLQSSTQSSPTQSSSAPLYIVINAAFEESTLSDRQHTFPPHDAFVASHLSPNDIVIVSVGGNDIALKPSFKTIISMLGLTFFTSSSSIESQSLSGCSIRHIKELFYHQYHAYIQKLISITQPKLIIPCGIYYPCEEGSGWADPVLSFLKYKKQPRHLQLLIDYVFQTYISKLSFFSSRLLKKADENQQCLTVDKNKEETTASDMIPTVAVPLYRVLDCKNPSDYVARVEPSVQGGKKMAKCFIDIILLSDKNNLDNNVGDGGGLMGDG